MSVSSASNSNYLQRTTGFVNTDKVTIACWLQLDDLTADRSIWDHGDNTNFSPQLYFDPAPLAVPGNVPSILFAISGSAAVQVIASPSTGVWYWVAVVFRGGTGSGARPFIYVGTAGGALTKFTPAINFTLGFSGTKLTLFNELGIDQALNGRLRDFKVWKGAGGALADEEIANEYLRSRPSKTVNAYCNLPLLNAASPGVDVSGLGNDFTLTGTLTTDRAAPPVTRIG